MLRMAQRVKTPHSRLSSDIHHSGEGLRRVALPPGILGEHVTGHGLLGTLESQPRPSEQPTIAAASDQGMTRARRGPITRVAHNGILRHAAMPSWNEGWLTFTTGLKWPPGRW